MRNGVALRAGGILVARRETCGSRVFRAAGLCTRLGQTTVAQEWGINQGNQMWFAFFQETHSLISKSGCVRGPFEFCYGSSWMPSNGCPCVKSSNVYRQVPPVPSRPEIQPPRLAPVYAHRYVPPGPVRSHQVPSGPTRSHQVPPGPVMSHQIPSWLIKSHQVPSPPINVESPLDLSTRDGQFRCERSKFIRYDIPQVLRELPAKSMDTHRLSACRESRVCGCAGRCLRLCVWICCSYLGCG